MRRARLSRSRLSLIALTCSGLAFASPALAAVGLPDPIAAPIAPSGITVGMEVVASGLVSPVKGVPAPSGKGLVVIDQGGKIYAVDTHHSGSAPRVIADLSGLLVTNLGKVIPGLAYDERGLLGVAFGPGRHGDRDGNRSTGLVYTFANENVDPLVAADFSTQPAGVAADSRLVLREWRLVQSSSSGSSSSGSGHDFRSRSGGDLMIDPASSRVVLRIDKPQFNHNGGDIAFGPDGMLYLAVGDGGAADDQGPGHAVGGNAQSLAPGNVLGKILRIDPRGRTSANGQYAVPADNPLLGKDGADEIWAYGFRNPYRFSFDAETGALVVGDVGQNDIEEIDVVEAGKNYGWPVKEGTFLFDANGAAPGFVTANSPGVPAGLTDPVTQYDHTAPGGVRCGFGAPATACEGIAVVGGAVYRGDEVDDLEGDYVFGDYSRAFARPLGRLFVARDGVTQSLAIDGRTDLGLAVTGFAQDRHGEIYVLGNTTGVLSGTTGQVLRLTEVDDDDDDDGRGGRH